MSKLLQKLTSRRGESLVESLAAILVFTMASIVLFSMVTAAGDINGKVKTMDRDIQDQLVAIEKGLKEYTDEDGTTINVYNGEATVTMELSDGTPIASIKVDIYGGQDGSLYAYYVAPQED